MGAPNTDSSGQIVQPRDITHIGGTAQTGRDWSGDMSKLDIALSALRDAIEGAGDKNFTTLDTLLQTALIRDITKWGGTSLTGRNISSDLQVLTDLIKGASNADGLAAQASNVLAALSKGLLFNESTWDRARGNTEVELLASGDRTASTSSPDQTNYNARGVLVFFNVTARPGAETLSFAIRVANGALGPFNIASSATVNATGLWTLMLYPGLVAASAQNAYANYALPRSWHLRTFHDGGGGTWTYSARASLLV